MNGTTTRFLVVDDVSTMRKMIKNVLAGLGYTNVVEASDGLNAIEMLKAQQAANQPIEFIISDWNMPNMRGIDFLKHCRTSELYKTIPFIMVTAESEQHIIVDAAKAGVSDYVVKPFSPEKLKEKIERVRSKMVAKKAA